MGMQKNEKNQPQNGFKQGEPFFFIFYFSAASKTKKQNPIKKIKEHAATERKWKKIEIFVTTATSLLKYLRRFPPTIHRFQ